MDYESFSLRFEPDRDGRYGTVAQSANGATARGTFEIPGESAELAKVLLELGAEVRRSGPGDEDSGVPSRDLKPVTPPQFPGVTPRELGRRLFEALFSGPVRSLFDQSVGSVEKSSGRGLRIELHFDPEHPDLVRLSSLPWELLFWHDRREFLSLSRFSPVVRYLDVTRPARSLDLGAKLRILVAVSPSRARPLDLERERHEIEGAWGGDSRIEAVFLDPVTLPELRKALNCGPFHVLHFMGHGEFFHATGEGALIFNDDRGDENPVAGPWLASLLRDEADLQLVLLNTCHSARSTTEEGLDPFAGVGTALVKAGIPAVVAMQFPISDQAAIAFSSAFYERLASGQSLGAAAAAGRKAILADDVDSLEWATPVLFRRTSLEIPPVDRRKKGRKYAFPRTRLGIGNLSVILLLASILGIALTMDFAKPSPGNNQLGPGSVEDFGIGNSELCDRLVFDLDLGTLAGLGPGAPTQTILKSLPCEGNAVSADRVGFGFVDFQDHGFRFATDRRFIAVDTFFRGELRWQGKPIEILEVDRTTLLQRLNFGWKDRGDDLIYDRGIGCVQIVLANAIASEVIVHEKNCNGV